MIYTLSVDLGKEGDYTAYVIQETVPIGRRVRTTLDIQTEKPGRQEVDYIASIRYIERPDVGTPYPSIVERTKILMATPPFAGNMLLVVDVTGVGIAVLDWLRREGLQPIGINIHAGEEVRENKYGGFSVPKFQIAYSLQLLAYQHRLKISPGMGLPKEDLTEALKKEIENFKGKISKRGNATFEAWRETDHDDITLAAGMGTWLFNREHPTRHVYYPPDESGKYNPKTFK